MQQENLIWVRHRQRLWPRRAAKSLRSRIDASTSSVIPRANAAKVARSCLWCRWARNGAGHARGTDASLAASAQGTLLGQRRRSKWPLYAALSRFFCLVEARRSSAYACGRGTLPRGANDPDRLSRANSMSSFMVLSSWYQRSARFCHAALSCEVHILRLMRQQ
jgi:hypothetical protein